MQWQWPVDKTLKKINWALFASIILINGYIFITPFYPEVTFAVNTTIAKKVAADASKPDTLAAINRSYNHLIIPRLQLDEKILEGTDPTATLDKGAWLRPQGSIPSEGSNTVIVGHRFTYDKTAVFYHLDKLQKNDDVFVVYDKILYRYVIQSSEIVLPSEVRVEDPTNDSRLTLYTCTPLVTASHRLVLTAPLKEIYE